MHIPHRHKHSQPLYALRLLPFMILILVLVLVLVLVLLVLRCTLHDDSAMFHPPSTIHHPPQAAGVLGFFSSYVRSCVCAAQRTHVSACVPHFALEWKHASVISSFLCAWYLSNFSFLLAVQQKCNTEMLALCLL
jgi:hypothetical protein